MPAAYSFQQTLATQDANFFTAIANMGYYDVRVGSTLCPADVFVALDDAGNIWTLGYVYYNNTVELYTLDDVEKTTLPELSYPGFDQYDSSMSSLVYAEEESGDVLYLSYFNGETNDIYRLAYSTDDGGTHYWDASCWATWAARCGLPLCTPPFPPPPARPVTTLSP